MSVEGRDFGAVALMAATHDLTAPLVLLRQLSFQLDQQIGRALPDASKSLAQMRLAISRTFDIADQLQLATASNALALEPVPLASLCRDLGEVIKPLQRQRHCQVDFELPRRQPVVAVGNYQALKTVMTGFLTDAMRYTDDDSTNDADRIIRVRVHANRDGEVAMAICDNGPAINLTQTLQLSTDGKDLNPSGSRPLMGSLNLLLANRLMTAMNGRIVVHNHRRGGLTIETLLPMSRQLSLLDGVA